MAELRLQIPDDVAKRLQEQLGNAKLTDIARDALTMFNWAIEEKAKGRVVLSSDQEGEKMTRLVISSLEKVRARHAGGAPDVPDGDQG
jgi:hypothetical protein